MNSKKYMNNLAFFFFHSYVKLINLVDKIVTYDFSPFPYIPIIEDSVAFLLDLPKVMISAASSMKQTCGPVTDMSSF